MSDETPSRSDIETGSSESILSPERLATLHNYAILDTLPEPVFDRLTELTAWFFHVPMAAIALIDGGRVWLKSHYGFVPAQIGHEIGLWAAVILVDDIYCITNAAEDPRTHANPLVTGELELRFYAAAPLRNQEGHTLGSLCVLDRQSREITEIEKEFLRRMADIVMESIELRLTALSRYESTDVWDNEWIDE
jgi:GAF domain-containing protein